jgi:hypothetical protein
MTRFEHELRKRIAQEVERLTGDLAAGMAVKSYDQYQNYVGRIKALMQVAEEFCAEVETKLNED